MPDITMCNARSCPLRNTCYRFTAQPGRRQSYFAGFPSQGESCTYYWPVSGEASQAHLPRAKQEE